MAAIAETMTTERLFHRYYYSRPDFVDGTTDFHRLIEDLTVGDDHILEIGAGPSNATSQFLSTRGRVIGVDVSPEVLNNEWLAEAKVYDGNRLPFPDGHFSLCVSNYVLEHVTNPDTHFGEIRRVLRGGGLYCFRTPNLFHYVTLASKMLPHRAHLNLANRLRGLGCDAHDPYPTIYAANTRRLIRRLAGSVGLTVKLFRMIEKEPSYGKSNRLLFSLMMVYERCVNSSSLLLDLRVNILAVLQKPA
jgi:SAM-dependent methyltransferase